MDIIKFMKNEETISMAKDIGKVLCIEAKNTFIIGCLARGTIALKNVGFKNKKKQKSKTKEPIVIRIDTDKLGKKVVTELGKTLAIGTAARVGAEVMKVSKGLVKNSNENIIMNAKRARTFVEEYKEN